MPASFARPSPVRQQIVDSLMFMAPPSNDHLAELLAEASSATGWAAFAMQSPDGRILDLDEEQRADAEAAVFRAYLALYARRKDGRPS